VYACSHKLLVILFGNVQISQRKICTQPSARHPSGLWPVGTMLARFWMSLKV